MPRHHAARAADAVAPTFSARLSHGDGPVKSDHGGIGASDGGGVRRLTGALRDAVAAEQDRFFLWVPVLFGLGVGLYFAAPQEPPLWPILASAGLAVLVTRVWRAGLWSLVVGGMAASILLGLATAKVASDMVAAPVLDRSLREAVITGWVELIEPRAMGGERLTIRTISIDGLGEDERPRRVRVRIPRQAEDSAAEPRLTPGLGVRIRANLVPPAGPALPGAFDFARLAWFQGLGAVGSARQRPEAIVVVEPVPWTLRLWAPIEALRQRIGQRIAAALPGERGAIAVGLVTGERGGISEATNTAYRDSGIFHILSISGLHMTIFAGALYFSARLLLSLSPRLALAFPIKKWAAVAGIVGTGGYLLISGLSPPAVRSAIMIGIMFVAILLDRPALALRNVALAALIVLVVTPASLIDIGFQMSFAAVVALIAGIEAANRWRRARSAGSTDQQVGHLGGVAQFLGAIVVTTLIATVAVAPFAAFYFHKSTQYGILANLVAVPLCNLIVMPAALATLIAMPFGLEAWPLMAMGWGIDAMNWVAGRVAALPGAVTLVPAIPAVAFGLMVAGGLWLCLWHGRWRLFGLALVALGLAAAPWRQAPDILVGADGSLVGIRGADGRLAVLAPRRSAFEIGRWLEFDADGRRPQDVGPGDTIRCDEIGCQATASGVKVGIVRHAAALAEACRLGGVVIWLGAGAPSCGGPGVVVVGRDAVRKLGTHTITLASGRPTVSTVAAWRGDRPWSRSQSSDAAPRAANFQRKKTRFDREAPRQR